ncbi:hypothetical protein [Metapseudomonas otitidis]|uniref:hypothetical protein n=1 Tax=Metapseudomonas otitidis TaxID=319939 RepID=UPI0013F5FB76|nr:hypothetical protein [Pseudomonas otitidis]
MRLEDDRYGLALDLRPSQPPRPTLPLQDSQVPKEKALANALQPTQVPAKTRDCLTSRQRITGCIVPRTRG